MSGRGLQSKLFSVGTALDVMRPPQAAGAWHLWSEAVLGNPLPGREHLAAHVAAAGITSVDGIVSSATVRTSHVQIRALRSP
jgi:hypothetical protein